MTRHAEALVLPAFLPPAFAVYPVAVAIKRSSRPGNLKITLHRQADCVETYARVARRMEASTLLPPLRPVSCTPHTRAAPAGCLCMADAVCCSVPPTLGRPYRASKAPGPSLCGLRVMCRPDVVAASQPGGCRSKVGAGGAGEGGGGQDTRIAAELHELCQAASSRDYACMSPRHGILLAGQAGPRRCRGQQLPCP